MNRITAILLLITLAAPAWGQDLDKGLQAYQRGDYASALEEWRPLAEGKRSLCAAAVSRIGRFVRRKRTWERLPHLVAL